MSTGLALVPVRLPNRPEKAFPRRAAPFDFVEGLALAVDEDDGLLILTDDTFSDIIP